MSEVTCKRHNYELWTSGAYGNRLRAWRSVEEWRRSGFFGRVVLRVLGKVGEGYCTYGLRPEDVDHEYRRWLVDGVRSDEVMVNEMAPDDQLVLNGEYHHDILPDGTFRHLFFSRVKKPMRLSLREDHNIASGIVATMILRHAMTDGSWEDFSALVVRYPSHVVELSVYNHCLGDTPGRNALIWEVRKY